MRIAHLSDLHLLALDGMRPQRLLNKRFTGWVNVKLRRGAIHQRAAAQAVAREVRSRGVDHVVITGDVTNLALESEFEMVRAYLQNDLGMPPEQVSVVPGNHDAYTRGAHRSRRFQCYLGEYITSDLPAASSVPNVGRFPFVRLRGPVAIVGLSSAVPRLPLVASGELGKPQRMALLSLLSHDAVRERTPVVIQHHPWHRPQSAVKAALQGLSDAEQEREVLNNVARGLLLHGHLHRLVHRTIPTARGHIDAVCATSASLVHDSEHQMSGFNVYDIDDDGGITALHAYRHEPDSGHFVDVEIPRG